MHGSSHGARACATVWGVREFTLFLVWTTKNCFEAASLAKVVQLVHQQLVYQLTQVPDEVILSLFGRGGSSLRPCELGGGVSLGDGVAVEHAVTNRRLLLVCRERQALEPVDVTESVSNTRVE